MNLELDTMVELLDQYSDVYPRSPTGARGWIRGKRQLSKSDPEIYIEWDKTHWRYQQERDGWTFEHHFKPVQDIDLHEILADAQRQVESERCPDCGRDHQAPQEFLELLMQAQEKALGSDGFFIITLTPKVADGVTIYEPEIFSHTLTDAAECMIKAQLAYFTSQLYAQSAVETIRQLRDDNES